MLRVLLVTASMFFIQAVVSLSPPTPAPPHPCATGSPYAATTFCNASAPAVERAKDLTKRLSVLEKATVISINGGFHGKWASEEFGLHVTGYTECSHASGSPHGSAQSPHNGWRVTVFPAVMSTARSFSRELVSAIANAIGHETRAKHNNETGRSPKGPAGAWSGESSLYCFAPMINVCRDPRWGRCQEGNGEDPLLGHEFGRLYVEGYQNDEGTGVLKAVATPKHFDVFSGPGNAPCPDSTHPQNECDVEIGLRDWMTTFQPAFRGAIIGGKARSVMCSYNSINGQPNCGNRHLLTDILREEWGFDGHVVSDCGGVDHIWAMHHTVSDLSEAAAMALRAGCDADCGHDYQQGVPLMIANGTIDMQLLDRAVTRVLTNRMLLGELEDDTDLNPWRNLTLEVLLPPHKLLARRAAREAVVLLKNGAASASPLSSEMTAAAAVDEPSQLLPLPASSISKVAVVGPSADSASAYIGDYAPQPAYYTTVTTGAKVALPHATVVSAPGCDNIFCGKNDSFAPAVAAAGSVGTGGVVVFVGGLNGTFNLAEGEGHDRTTLALPGFQEELMVATHAAAKQVGAKFIVVLVGSPVTANWAQVNADAVLAAGYGGQEAGNAVWDIILGVYNPSGRLSNTWPASDSQLPNFTSYDMRKSPGRTYQYLEPSTTPLYRFGAGLSYGVTVFSALHAPTGSVDVCDDINLTVAVAHTGPTADVIVQVYMQFLNASVPVPRLTLVQFEKLYNMSSGDKRTVTLTVQPERRVVITDQTFLRTVEPQPVRLWVGDGQPAPNKLAAAASGDSGDNDDDDDDVVTTAGTTMGATHLSVVVPLTGQSCEVKSC